MNNFDKEATKLNAIHLLSALAMGRTFISPTEEMIYVAQKSNRDQNKLNLVNAHMMEMDIKDQLLLGRMAVILSDISSMLCEKYGLGSEEDDFEENI